MNIPSEVISKMRDAVPAFAERIAPVYKALSWAWYSREGWLYIPDKKEIEDNLYILIDWMISESKRPENKTKVSCTSGGLEVKVEKVGSGFKWTIGFICDKYGYWGE